VRFSKDLKPEDGPELQGIVLVLQGRAEIRTPKADFALAAPPGPALLEWDNRGGEVRPHRLETVPKWALEDKPSDEVAKKKRAVLERFGQLMEMKKSPGDVAEEFLGNDDPYFRRVGIFVLAATDDLGRLVRLLTTTKHQDVIDNGILAFRHWIGRCPGQDRKLYDFLIEKVKLSEGHAAIILNLLHSFSDDDVNSPELYETLIGYLTHDLLSIRSLANWHLVRLSPSGKKLGYNPLASKEDREKAQAQWEKHIPTGKLPPERRKDK
jgi:hypothetical protein